MAQDPLYQALGVAPTDSPPPARGHGRLWIGLAVVVALAAGAAVLTLRRDGSSNPAVVVARIEPAPTPPPTPPAPPLPPTASEIAPTATDTVEIQHGVKIIRLGQATSPASIRVSVPDAATVKLARAPDPRLVETSRFGALPRIGPDGSRPAEVYARPVAGGGAVRVAIVLGGMGREQLQTAQAGQRLAPAVTFAFPPDGPDLAAQVAETRAAGHEVVLQLPDDLATVPDTAGLDPLHRAMAAFVGYAGVLLPAPPPASAALADDVAKRGLYAIGGVSAPTGRAADIVIRATDDAAATAAGLARLAATARARHTGVAVIERAGPNIPAIAAFVDGLTAEGIQIVPASALADPHARDAAAPN